MKTPKKVSSLSLECTCVDITITKHDTLMLNRSKANKRIVNQLVKTHLRWLYDSLSLDFYNPYNYYKTKTHLILVHSEIDYFLRFQV
jgi:hypothetical protein